jgi:hypothetical protein
MRLSGLAIGVLLAFGLASCNRRADNRREDHAAREAGRDAYRASQEVKRGAREAGRELHNAGKEFRQGWNDAKHSDRTTRDK